MPVLGGPISHLQDVGPRLGHFRVCVAYLWAWTLCHRFGVTEGNDAVLIVPLRLVVTLIELETEVLPAVNVADFSKRHPSVANGFSFAADGHRNPGLWIRRQIVFAKPTHKHFDGLLKSLFNL